MIYGLEESVLLKARTQLADNRTRKIHAHEYSLRERCELVRRLLSDGRARTPKAIAEELLILPTEASTALQEIRDELDCDKVLRAGTGGRFGVWSLR